VFYEGVKMYNSLPVGIKQCDGLRTFKRELKEYFETFLVTLIDSVIILFRLRFAFFALCILFLYFIVVCFVLIFYYQV